ncbi:helix-turn-helix transcriptional regulator [Micromonospora sp. WMMD558]|uniref:helix-turn-helix transcriptional regulator n=1 Tax=unclassified Micromonospora TaxID=2617518 RepID=UPI001E562261|nr:helix-turn-helix transcriptional regulator [Micromonospora sp. WMMC415]
MWIRALKAARASAGVSQEALAELIRWSPSTIAAIETGRRRPTPQFATAQTRRWAPAACSPSCWRRRPGSSHRPGSRRGGGSRPTRSPSAPPSRRWCPV